MKLFKKKEKKEERKAPTGLILDWEKTVTLHGGEEVVLEEGMGFYRGDLAGYIVVDIYRHDGHVYAIFEVTVLGERSVRQAHRVKYEDTTRYTIFSTLSKEPREIPGDNVHLARDILESILHARLRETDQ